MGDSQQRASFNRHLLHPWAELGNLGHDKELLLATDRGLCLRC